MYYSEAQAKNCRETIKKVSETAVDDKLVEDFMFKGFNLIEVEAELRKKIATQKERVSLIQQCALQVCLRGTSLAKQVLADKNTAGRQLKEKLDKEQIPLGKPRDGEVLSMSRIAHLGSSCVIILFSKKPLLNSLMNDSKNFPVCLQHTLAPSSLLNETDLYMWFNWSDKFTETINPASNLKELELRKEKSRQIGRSAFNSALITVDKRIEFFNSLFKDAEEEEKKKIKIMLDNHGSNKNINLLALPYSPDGFNTPGQPAFRRFVQTHAENPYQSPDNSPKFSDLYSTVKNLELSFQKLTEVQSPFESSSAEERKGDVELTSESVESTPAHSPEKKKSKTTESTGFPMSFN